MASSNNAMISVRIPAKLLEELKESSKKDHFLDLSESVRSIIRNNWLKHKDPLSHELTKIRKEITESLGNSREQEILDELRKLKESLISQRMR